MKVKRERFEQAVLNWASDDRSQASRCFVIEGLEEVTFVGMKGKTVSRCLVYFHFTQDKKKYSIRLGDLLNERIEEATKGNYRKFYTFATPLTVGDIETLIVRAYELGRDWKQILATLKTNYPNYSLEEMLKKGESLSSIALAREIKDRTQPFKAINETEKEDRPQIVAGASNAVEKTVTVIDPIKEVKLKNLEQELELIDLKIRKCEILKEISSLKQG